MISKKIGKKLAHLLEELIVTDVELEKKTNSHTMINNAIVQLYLLPIFYTTCLQLGTSS